jgi:transmembrane sensor
MNKPESVFYKLLLRKISGEITAAEMQRLAELLKAFPEFTEVYETVFWLWNDTDVRSLQRSSERSGKLLDRHMQRLHDAGLLPEKTPAPVAKRHTARRYWTGAGVLVAAACAIVLILYNRQGTEVQKKKPNVVMTRPGSRTRLILPDGTTVLLNASSKLTYGNDFQERDRQVYLDGEAFFDVAKDESKPFIIHTPVMDVRVLGTSFNLRSYTGDGKAEAVLIKGKIEVQVKHRPQERYLLSSYEKLSLVEPAGKEPGRELTEPKALTISSIDFWGKDSVVAETAWIDNRLVFAGETLSELAARMERWFDASITVTGTRLQEFRMTGSFKDETLEESLKAISLITGCKYRLKDHVAQLYDD